MVECYSPLNKTMLYYGNTTSPGAHFPFNFLLISSFDRQSDAYQVNDMVKSWMLNMPEGSWANWVVSVEYVLLLVFRRFNVYKWYNWPVDNNLDRKPRQSESRIQDEPTVGGRLTHATNSNARHADHVLRWRTRCREHIRPVERDGRSSRP